MTAAATADVVDGRTHDRQRIRHHGGNGRWTTIPQRRRIGEGGVAGSMAATANGGGNFNPRDNGGIIRGVGMIGRRAVAIFALHTGQVGGVENTPCLLVKLNPVGKP